VILIETEPDEAEEDGNIEHTADTHLSRKVDEEEEAKDHTKRERNRADEDSIDTDTEEGLDNISNEFEEAIDVFTRNSELLVSKLAGSFFTLEEANDVHDIEADTSKKSKEGNPADKTKNGEIVAEKKDEEDIDNAEDCKGDHKILPQEDFLSLAEEFALLERLEDHVTGTFTRAGRSALLGGFLLRSFLSWCRLGFGLCRGCCSFFFMNFRCRFVNFVRHC